MSIKATVISEIEQVRGGSGNHLPALTDDLVLVESGLDSLGVALLVTRLEDTLGLDPFAAAEATSRPVTLGDLIRLYENATPSS
jgi:acyl carrier protein